MNGYDAYSTAFARRGRTTVAEAAGDKRSDGEASQTRDGANRYDTSTPERRRKALAAARRSGNPSDEAKVRRQINQEANSTIDALMLGLGMGSAARDNRVRRQGGYRSPTLAVHEAAADGKLVDEASGDDKGLPTWMKDKMDEARGGSGSSDPDGEAPPFARKKGRRGKVAESALNPQIRFRETLTRDSFHEAKVGNGKNLPPWLRKDKDDEDDTENSSGKKSSSK